MAWICFIQKGLQTVVQYPDSEVKDMMEKNKIQKITQPLIRLPHVNSMGVIGDPGCEGLGTYNMKVYAGALEKSAQDDITLIAGDLVPIGNEHYYEEISEITEVIAHNDVYVLRGNHDTGAYVDYFGRKNYALETESFTVWWFWTMPCEPLRRKG